MTKKLFSLCVAFAWTVALMAQQISVVSPSGSTQVFKTLQAAIEGASYGSVIYLPGGGFNIDDSVKVTKKLTIIGIGHKANGENVDGNTMIYGNLFFNEGSSGSAVVGCYLSGRVIIGDNGIVDNVLVKLCFLNGIDVKNSNCVGTTVNQNYIVDRLLMGNSNVIIKNNIVRWTNTGYGPCIYDVGSGVIQYNILLHGSTSMYNVNATVTNNVITAWERISGQGIITSSDNMGTLALGDYPIVIHPENGWDDVFINYNNGAVSTTSNFHFKDGYKQYENIVGIYAGTGFDDDALPPMPYIVAKKVDEQTDANGKLNIKIRIRAGE
jgi:hypothetical protein